MHRQRLASQIGRSLLQQASPPPALPPACDGFAGWRRARLGENASYRVVAGALWGAETDLPPCSLSHPAEASHHVEMVIRGRQFVALLKTAYVHPAVCLALRT